MYRTVGSTSLSTQRSDPLAAVCIATEGGNQDETEVLIEVQVPSPKLHYEEGITLLLGRGGWSKETDQLIETYGEKHHRVMVTDDEIIAIGYFIHLLEIHDTDTESRIQRKLSNHISDLYETYQEWLTTQTQRKRKLRLLDQSEQAVKYDDFYQPVLQHSDAKWRSQGLSSRNTRRVEAAISRIDVNPELCYKNARRIVTEFKDDDSVQYVEGIALSKHATRIVGHAWVEFKNRVAEVTWPWHRPDPTETGAVYYGVPVSKETVNEATERSDFNSGPLVLYVDYPDKLG